MKVVDDEIVFSGNRLIDYMETEDEKISIEMDTVEKMIYHTPIGPGDLHFVDVIYKDGSTHRIFNPMCVVWRSDE